MWPLIPFTHPADGQSQSIDRHGSSVECGGKITPKQSRRQNSSRYDLDIERANEDKLKAIKVGIQRADPCLDNRVF